MPIGGDGMQRSGPAFVCSSPTLRARFPANARGWWRGTASSGIGKPADVRDGFGDVPNGLAGRDDEMNASLARDAVVLGGASEGGGPPPVRRGSGSVPRPSF